MLKKAAIIIAALIGVAGAVALWFRNEGAVSTAGARPWPDDMGTLYNVAERWPPQKANDASVKLTNLAGALPKNEAIDDFVAREIMRGEVTINEAPPLPDVSAIRELLLREPIVWERYDEVGDQNAISARAMHMTLARTLIASALSKARENDPAAWNELHAVWKLARTLDGHPQMMTQTAALSMDRMVNAVAWKMPLPVPGWLSELQSRDNVQQLLASFQFQAASYWKDGARIFPTKWLANSVENDRGIAEELSKLDKCDVNARMNELGTDLTSLWRRAFRYRVEREATANALRIREGKPFESNSRCSDGKWMFDGVTLRFSREIPTAAPDTPMPLVLMVKPVEFTDKGKN